VRKGRTGGAPLEGLSAAGERALAVLKEETGSREIAGDDRLELDLGIDSLGRVSLMTALEKVCGIVIREEEFLPLLTVSELIRYVECAAERGGERIARGERSWSDIVNAGLPAALARSVSLEVGPLSRLLTFSVSLVVGVVCVLYFRLTVRGREHLGEGSCIICPNHTSYLDGFLIFTALPLGMKYRLFFLGLRNYFEVPVLRSMLRSLRIIPVDPARNIVETLQASAFVLKHGKVLCVFPEGARSITGELKEFKKGVAILAKEAGAQIVPAYIDGSHRAWKPGTWLPRPRTIAVVFGRAQSFDDLVRRSGPAERHGDEYERASAGLRAAVVALLGRTAL
jgi:long-chain acyl-CoA synthetase